MTCILHVAVQTPAHSGVGDLLSYQHTEALAPGTLVRVPLGQRDVLQGITPVPFHLVQQVVQDEACGLGGGPQEPMRLPISLQSAW